MSLKSYLDSWEAYVNPAPEIDLNAMYEPPIVPHRMGWYSFNRNDGSFQVSGDGRAFENSNDRRVAITRIEFGLPGEENVEGIFVSTVFLALDHSFMGEGPILFETLVQGGENYGGYEDVVERYATARESLDSHLRIVRDIKSHIPDNQIYGGTTRHISFPGEITIQEGSYNVGIDD